MSCSVSSVFRGLIRFIFHKASVHFLSFLFNKLDTAGPSDPISPSMPLSLWQITLACNVAYADANKTGIVVLAFFLKKGKLHCCAKLGDDACKYFNALLCSDWAQHSITCCFFLNINYRSTN